MKITNLYFVRVFIFRVVISNSVNTTKYFWNAILTVILENNNGREVNAQISQGILEPFSAGAPATESILHR